jgi:hypothetical protein
VPNSLWVQRWENPFKLDGKAEKRKTGSMKTTVDLPDSLFRRAKATAAERGVSLKTFITNAVEQSLARPQGAWRSTLTRLPHVPAETLEAVRGRVAEADAADLSLQAARGS